MSYSSTNLTADNIMLGNTGNANLTTNTTTQGTINFKEGNLKAECLEQNADATFQVVKIDPITSKLFRAVGSGGGGGGGDVFLNGSGNTKENLYTDDTKNEFKGEIVFGTGTAGEPKTAADMDANDRILSVDIAGKLVTNTRIDYLQKNSLTREEVESQTFFSNVEGLEVRNKVELVDSANPGGFAKIELDHMAPADNINIPIHHFSFVKSGEATGVTQMALASDIFMIRDGDVLVDNPVEPANTRGKPPDKAMGYNTTSGEITYIAVGGVGDAVLADANIFTKLNTFTLGIEAEDTKTVNLFLEDTTDPTKLANIKYTYTSNTDKVIEFDEGIRSDIMTTSDSRIRDPSFPITDNRFANIIYKYSTTLENFMQMDTNLKVRSADPAPASSEGTSLTVDTTTATFGGNPILQPYSILRFRLSDVNNSSSFTDETMHFNAGLDEFDLSKGLNAGGDVTANNGIVKFGDRNIVNPLDLIETSMTGQWQPVLLENNFLSKSDEPVEFRVIEHRRKSYPADGVGTANLKWYKIEFRGICSVVADFPADEVLFFFDNQDPKLPWDTNLTVLPPIKERQIVIGSYYVPALFTPAIVQSVGDQMPCRFIMRGDPPINSPRRCTTGGDSVIGWNAVTNATIQDLGKRKAGTQYVFENAYIWSD